MTLTDGTELAPALGIGAFAEKTLVAAGQRLIQCWLHIFVDLAAFGSDVHAYGGDRSTPRRIAGSEPSPIPARLGTIWERNAA